MVLYIDGEFHLLEEADSVIWPRGRAGVWRRWVTRAHFRVGPLVSSGKRGFDRFSVISKCGIIQLGSIRGDNNYYAAARESSQLFSFCVLHSIRHDGNVSNRPIVRLVARTSYISER